MTEVSPGVAANASLDELMAQLKARNAPTVFDHTLAYEATVKPLADALIAACKELGLPAAVVIAIRADAESSTVSYDLRHNGQRVPAMGELGEFFRARQAAAL